ncbi:MAG: MFS transporter, partial [Spirochaetia bacterium]|nr:MFS transporter [Spirochaetia bacterium]
MNRSKTNKVLLIQILLLDLIGFSLIFPLVPDLLEYYLNQAETHSIDGWFTGLKDFLYVLLPTDRRNEEDLIIILGGILASLYSFLQFLLSPTWGRLSDRIGRRPVLIFTSIGLSLSYLIWAFSSSFTAFVLSRILGGIFAGNLGVATASMADMTEAKDRTKSMGLLGAAFGIGFIIGPVIGGISSLWKLNEIYPEMAAFHPFTACALISFFLAVASALRNYTSFQETISEQSKAEDRWIRNPFSILKDLNSKGFYYLVIINLLYILLFSGFEFSLTFFYKLDFKLDPFEIGFIFLYLGFLIALGQGGLVRYLTPRLHEKKMAQIGLAMIPVPLVFLGYSSPLVSLSILMLFPVAIGSALVMPSLTGLGSILAPEKQQGLAMGVFR